MILLVYHGMELLSAAHLNNFVVSDEINSDNSGNGDDGTGDNGNREMRPVHIRALVSAALLISLYLAALYVHFRPSHGDSRNDSNAESNPFGFAIPLRDDDDEEDENDSEADEEEDVEKAAMESFVSEKFLAVTQSMDLTEREMLALRLAVVRDDVHLRAAIEVFRLEPDLEDLRDTLKRIARNIADKEEMG